VPAIAARLGLPAPPRFGPRAPTSPVANRQYADWPLRVASALIDDVLTFAPVVVGFVVVAGLGLVDERGDPSGAGLAIWIFACLGAFIVVTWNRVVREGSTGQSIGRQVTGTRLVSLQTGEPLGIGMALVRRLCHILDGMCCNLGYLWPLWDEQKQTFADKVVGSIVVRERP
jgi:uncharacterized RDD family membrane protein YckC